MPRAVKAEILESVCGPCWHEWEQLEVKVINEHQLSVIDPRHRQMLVQTCREFLNLPITGPGTPGELLRKVEESETPE
jgi:Fe-S cluster biosynthesis and repair protein YggX